MSSSLGDRGFRSANELTSAVFGCGRGGEGAGVQEEKEETEVEEEKEV